MTPELTCRSFRDRLMEYAASVLPEGDREAVTAHLTSCAGCRSELAGWQAIGAAIRADEQEIPHDTFTVASWDAIHVRLPSRPLLSINAIVERSDMEDDVPPIADARRARLTPSHPARRRPYVAVAAFLLVVTLAVAVFAVIGAGGGAHKKSVGVSPTAAAPSTCSTSQLKAEAPPYSSIRSISMVSPTDGWAVGFVWNWQSPTPPATLIMRFHNCAWEPFGQSIPSAWLYSVSMGSDGDGWAVGSTVNYISNPVSNAPNTTALYEPQSKQLLVLRLANGQWQRAAMPESDGAVIGATVRMTSTSDGWMLVNGGKSHTDPFAIAEADTVLHYTNGAWTAVPTPFKTPGTYFWDVASVTAGECWIAGYDPNTGASLVAHYQNGQWQTWNPVPSGDNYGGLTSIGVTSSHDVWAGSPYELFHFDGSTWTQVQLPTAPRQTSSGAFPELVMRSASDGWMVAPSATILNNKVAGPLALHYDGESWQWVTIPAPDMNGVLTMRYISNTQAWAAGGSFTLTSAGHVPQARFLFLDNGSWTEIPD